MKKLLLIIAAAFMLAESAQARIINPSDGQVWWGYFNESDFETADYTVGTGQAMTLMAGIYIPAGHEQLGQATIAAVRVYFASSAVSSLSNLKIWISKELPDKIADADFTQTTLGTLTAGANDFKLRTPYEVGGEGFYIGYSVKSTTGYFIRCGGTDAPNAYWIGNPEAGMSWTDLNGNGLGKLAFQILVEGGNFQTNSATVEDFGLNMVLQGEEASVPITVKNMGANPIENISYTIATDGGEPAGETEVPLGSLSLGGSKTLSIPFPSDAETRKYQKTFTVTKVNGQPNAATNPSGTGFLITLKDKQPVTPVVEEFTGTWCGWCPRGTVGMEKVHETYGDQVVQIAAHNGDVMAISEYQPVIMTYAGGFPSSITDRQFEADPSFSGLKSAIAQAFSRVAPAAISLAAEWDSDEQQKVIFNTSTRFSFDDANGQYGIALVLVEDGLKGTASGWAQSNYYSGSGTGDMAWWGSQGSSVTGLEYNHVAVAAWSPQSGIDGSVAETISASVKQQFSYTGDIASNTLIQDKSKLKAVAMLIDRTNGTIVNAAQADIMAHGTGIAAVASSGSNKAEAIYSVDGRQIVNGKLSNGKLPRGLNIVRMSDGTVRKVLVK